MNYHANNNNNWWIIVGVVCLLTAAIVAVKTTTKTDNIYWNIWLDIEQNLVNADYKDNDTSINNSNLYQAKIEKIVIHHTATLASQDASKLFNAINREHAARWKRWGIDKTWQQMMYHRLIWSDWSVFGDKDFNEIWWWTRENNVWVVHIALQGNFNTTWPTEAQYQTLQQMINLLKRKYGQNIIITGHWQLEHEHTACPWKYFDRKRIVPDIEETVNATWIMFSLSRYYSPMTGQNRYYLGKSYEADVIMNCWKDAINNDGCLYPADWNILTNADKNKAVACPKEYKIGTKIYLEWIWVVTCRDRGSAIKGNRIDVYCWVWTYALDNWDTCKTGKVKWYIVK